MTSERVGGGTAYDSGAISATKVAVPYHTAM